jgi:hypothetical protein
MGASGGFTPVFQAAGGGLTSKHFYGTGTAPGVAASGAWGTAPTVTVSGNDSCLNVKVTAAATTATSPTLTITFNSTYTTAPIVLPEMINSDEGAGINTFKRQLWVTAVSATACTITFHHLPVAGNFYDFNVQVIGR